MPAPVKPVFISYARGSSGDLASALYERLDAECGAFLDTADIDVGGRLPTTLVDALLGARVIVVFADDTYFTRWYCLREFDVALAAFSALVLGHADERARAEALAPLVIGLAVDASSLDALPSITRQTNWPAVTDTAHLAELVLRRVTDVHQTIGQRLLSLGQLDAVRGTLLEEAAVPSSRALPSRTWSLAGELPETIHDEFVGRADELWQIHHRLSTIRGIDGAGVTVSIEGGGGTGKTRLAAEYVHRFGARHYPGGVFWVNASLPERLDEQLHGILSVLVPATPPLRAFLESDRDAAAELRDAIRREPAKQLVLYVVDNVPEPAPGEPPRPLTTWCPAVGDIALLVTSRASQSVLGGVKPVAVNVLGDEPSRLLLARGYTGRGRLTEEEWDEIVDWVGGLPLALVLLNASLGKHGVEPERLLDIVRSGAGTLEELDASAEALAGVVPEGKVRSITKAFSVSYHRTPEPVRRAACLLARMAYAPIPVAILDALPPEAGGRSVRLMLTTRSFVTPVPDGDRVPMFGRMHPVLGDFLRAQVVDVSDDLAILALTMHAIFSTQQKGDTAKWPLLNACLPHALAVHRQLVESEAKDTIVLGLRLGSWIWSLVEWQGFVGLSLDHRNADAELSTRTLGPDDPLTLKLQGNLATALHVQGRFTEARQLEERVLEGRRRVLGDDDPDTINSLGRLAVTLSSLGDRARSREITKTVFEARLRLLGPEHAATLIAQANLAELAREDADFAEARALAERVLEVQLRLLGPDNTSSIRSMNNLAATLRGQGALEDARKLGEEAVARYRQQLGDDHPDTLRSVNNLAETISLQGGLEDAAGLHEAVLAAQRRLLGQDHPETLRTMALLAKTLRARGDVEAAQELETVLAAIPPQRRGRTAQLA